MPRFISVVTLALLLGQLLPINTAKAEANASFEIPFTIQETAAVNRNLEPVTSGIPLPQGLVTDSTKLRLFNENNEIVPVQIRESASYPDGSLRWILLDFQTSLGANQTKKFKLSSKASQKANTPTQSVSVITTRSGYQIDTGLAKFDLGNTGVNLFEQITINGIPLLSDEFQGIVLTGPNADKFFTKGSEAKIEIIESGPLKAQIKISGKHSSFSGSNLLNYSLYLNFYAGKSFFKAFYRVENPQPAVHPGNFWDLGNTGSQYFEEISFQLDLSSIPDAYAVAGEPKNGISTGSFLNTETVKIYQDSSGGENWQSQNHVNRSSQVKTSFRGYKITADQTLINSGNRALGFIDISNPNVHAAIGLRHFWQNFPGAIESSKQGKLKIKFFPREFDDSYELQGGEHKTHEFFVAFDTQNLLSYETNYRLIQALNKPLIISVDDDWYLASGVFYDHGKYIPNSIESYENLLKAAVIPTGSNQRTQFSQRETIDEYGWRNFGDVLADHETICGTQSWNGPISHYNNQYDGFFGSLAQYARRGFREYYDLGEEGIRHLADIDIYHIAPNSDNGLYEGGMFPHTTHDSNAETATHRTWSSKHASQNCTTFNQGGGPDPWHNYTDGIWTYYFLSGYEPAREAAVETSEYMLKRVNNSTVGNEARAHANAITTLLNAYKSTGNEKYLTGVKSEISYIFNNQTLFSGLNWDMAMLTKSIGRFMDVLVEKKELDSEANQQAKKLLKIFADRMISDYKLPAGDIQGLRFSDALIYAYKYNIDQDTYFEKAKKIFLDFSKKYWAIGTYTNAKEMNIALTNGHMYLSLTQPADIGNIKIPEITVPPADSDETDQTDDKDSKDDSAAPPSTAKPGSCLNFDQLTDLENHWGKEIIRTIVCKGLMHGHPDQKFRPNASLNRAEASKVIALAINPDAADYPLRVYFLDMIDLTLWYVPYITFLKDQSHIDGYPDGRFYPSLNLNRAETVKLIMALVPDTNRAADIPTFDDVPQSSWYEHNIALARQLGIVEGFPDNTFRPSQSVSRAEFAAMLARALAVRE